MYSFELIIWVLNKFSGFSPPPETKSLLRHWPEPHAPKSLFEVWFGIIANQLFDELKRNYSKHCITAISFISHLFYYPLEIIFIIKTKFLSIMRYFYHCFRILL
jgi:hypothetical protein